MSNGKREVEVKEDGEEVAAEETEAFEIFSSGRSDSRGYPPGRDVGQKERLESCDRSSFLEHHRRFSKAAIEQTDSRAPFL
ncbi:hypothetical protein RUM43_005640 [Polyplax serrata]|uniref:Uncharacterized protein n=1 Tax=Polyplax serrata TaxID=468196 RepID=A0AAN8S1M5_POLSC